MGFTHLLFLIPFCLCLMRFGQTFIHYDPIGPNAFSIRVMMHFEEEIVKFVNVNGKHCNFEGVKLPMIHKGGQVLFEYDIFGNVFSITFNETTISQVQSRACFQSIRSYFM